MYRNRKAVKKALAVLLALGLLLFCSPGLGETYISDGNVIRSAEAGLTLTISPTFEYMGKNGPFSGYRNKDIGLLIRVTEFTDMDDYIADLKESGLSVTQETAFSSGSLQVEIFWADHSDYVAFIAAKELRKESSPVMDLAVARISQMVDASELVREIAGNFRSIADVLEEDQDTDTWDNFAIYNEVGLGIALPRSMFSEIVWTDDNSEAYLRLSNGICSILVNFFRCSIGELAVMNGFTSHDYEIYQSNTFNLWQFRPINSQDPMVDYIAFQGRDGTWMLAAFTGPEDVDDNTIWYYINQIHTAVFALE